MPFLGSTCDLDPQVVEIHLFTHTWQMQLLRITPVDSIISMYPTGRNRRCIPMHLSILNDDHSVMRSICGIIAVLAIGLAEGQLAQDDSGNSAMAGSTLEGIIEIGALLPGTGDASAHGDDIRITVALAEEDWPT